MSELPSAAANVGDGTIVVAAHVAGDAAALGEIVGRLLTGEKARSLGPPRRIVTTDRPAEAMPWAEGARYLYLGRDGRDLAGAPNDRAGPDDPCFERWLAEDAQGLWSGLRGWWALRQHGNVRLLHIEQLRRDPAALLRGLAEFLALSSGDWPAEALCKAASAIASGERRWREPLTPAQVESYEDRAVAALGVECATWLATGRIWAATACSVTAAPRFPRR